MPPSTTSPDRTLNRRDILKASGAAALVSFGNVSCGGGRVGVPTVSNTPAQQARFLNETELNTLKALVDSFIPQDSDPGGAASGCADAIHGLLSAFEFDPPLIFAGGPFSDRGGAQENDFQHFIPLDAYEERAWRLKIEGSQGLPEREFNGVRKGWQAIYQQGLAQLNQRAGELGFGSFAEMPAPSQELLLRDSNDELIADLVDIAFPHSLDAMYGAPEYGGNQQLNGWNFTAYDGDVQPRGYSDEEVTTPDNPGIADLLPIRRKARGDLPSAGLLAIPNAQQLDIIHAAFRDLMAMSSAELALSAMLNSESRLSRLKTEVNKFRPSQAKGGEPS